MSLVVSILVALIVLTLIISPFFLGEGGLLQAAAADNNLQRLQVMQERLIERYVLDAKAAAHGEIAKVSWSQRRRFLISRYVDITRRIDYLSKLEKAD